MGGELLARYIVEIVVRCEEHLVVVALPEVFDARSLGVGMVLARHMVGHEVDYHFQARAVRALHQRLEFFHAAGYVHGKVGVDIVVVGYGIGASGMAFYHMRVVARYAVAGIVGVVGMLYHARIPYVRGAEVGDIGEYGVGDVVELSRAVLFQSAAYDGCLTVVGVETRQQLVYYGLCRSHVSRFVFVSWARDRHRGGPGAYGGSR